MKRLTLLAAILIAAMSVAINAQEVTYVEDPSQGLLINKAPNNWFLTAEAGANLFMSPNDTHVEKFTNRIGGSFDLSLGKWVSPVFGLRAGVAAFLGKGACDGYYHDRGDMAIRPDLDYAENGYYAQKAWFVGPKLDAMLNLTNWALGYKPDRIYNAVFYLGTAVYFPFAKGGPNHNIYQDKLNPKVDENASWAHTGSKDIDVHLGILNKFAVSKRVDILVDLRFDYLQENFDDIADTRNCNLNLLVGIGYNFGKTDWNGPITAVCPTWKYTDAEGDALAARLQAAEAKIADLEKQLRDCLNRKPEVIEKDDAPLATIYFPINKTAITGVQTKVVNAVAEVMKQTDKEYLLTGWADNYTGNDKINTRLRKGRVATVKKALVRKGVEESRLETTINDGNLTNFGAKCASLDRAVTVQEKK
ncbi:MAG: OmpA family protein [Muribaculaceae bacterium]